MWIQTESRLAFWTPKDVIRLSAEFRSLRYVHTREVDCCCCIFIKFSNVERTFSNICTKHAFCYFWDALSGNVECIRYFYFLFLESSIFNSNRISTFWINWKIMIIPLYMYVHLIWNNRDVGYISIYMNLGEAYTTTLGTIFIAYMCQFHRRWRMIRAIEMRWICSYACMRDTYNTSIRILCLNIIFSKKKKIIRKRLVTNMYIYIYMMTQYAINITLRIVHAAWPHHSQQ